MTVNPPKFITKPLEASIIEKIELSLEECQDEELREILCPYCSTPLATVTLNMKEGFIVAKCHKCKSVTPLNLAYFYTSRAYSRPPAFLPDIETKI
ncbi:MAG: hypothetical protein ACI3XQ_06380 [Eubacteriales bacterium]